MGATTSYVNVRFTKEVKRTLPRKKQRGALSGRVVRALSVVDLDAVVLVPASWPERCRMTQVAVPEQIYLHSKAVAVKRACSFNRLLNSALAQLKRGKFVRTMDVSGVVPQ